jgi:hypothetical protein
LPSIIYAPPPRPKKIESRKSRVQLRTTSIVRNSGEIDETEETSRVLADKNKVDVFIAAAGHHRFYRT